MTKKKEKNLLDLNEREILLNHQFEVADFWTSKLDTEEHLEAEIDRNKAIPETWSLVSGVELYTWQKEALKTYILNKQGIAKVVTGAGKTMFALAAIEQLHNECCKSLKVLIVEPTIVLLNQWYDVIVNKSNLPEYAIGRLGGGYVDDLSDKQILIAVSNSVVLKLIPQLQNNNYENLMLVVDECHRLRGEVMRNVFKVKRRYCLGLSATPDVNDTTMQETEGDDGDKEKVDDVVLSELGGIFYTLTYDDAVRDGFLPEFEIHHIALPLNDAEKQKYKRFSDEITDTRERLFDFCPDAPRGGDLSGWATMKLNRHDTQEQVRSLCKAYISQVSKRKELLYKAKSREMALLRVLKTRLQNKDTQVILFHERIDEVMRLFGILWRKGIPVVPEHSQLTDTLRAQSVDLFRRGIARVIISGKALIEGFDAPAADIGINIASSGSRTKAIQSIGRVLRKNYQNDNKTGLIYRFYIADTIDEFIFKKTDFALLTGAKRNRYFFWNPSDESTEIDSNELPGPPYSPRPLEDALDWTTIPIGSKLDFEPFEEREFHIDNLNNIFVQENKGGHTRLNISNPQDIVEILAPYRFEMLTNAFVQTGHGRILIRTKTQDGQWFWVFCGVVPELFVVSENIADVSKAVKYKIKQFHGKKIIQEAIPVNGMAHNLPSDKAEVIFERMKSLPSDKLFMINTLFIENDKKVYCRIDNEDYIICEL